MTQTPRIADPPTGADAGGELRASPIAMPPRRGLRWRAYALVRPLVRPLAWRLRSFLTGPLQEEVAELRRQVEQLRTQLERRAAEERAALEPEILRVMEQALLTIALDREDR